MRILTVLILTFAFAAPALADYEGMKSACPELSGDWKCDKKVFNEFSITQSGAGQNHFVIKFNPSTGNLLDHGRPFPVRHLMADGVYHAGKKGLSQRVWCYENVLGVDTAESAREPRFIDSMEFRRDGDKLLFSAYFLNHYGHIESLGESVSCVRK